MKREERERGGKRARERNCLMKLEKWNGKREESAMWAKQSRLREERSRLSQWKK